MQSNLVDFIQVLRSHDIRVSPAETLDAVGVTTTLGYSDRNLLRDGLAMTLAKTPAEEVIFLDCFDRFFQQDLADFSSAEMSDPQDENNDTDATDDTAAQTEDLSTNQLSALELAAQNNPSLESLLQTPLMENLLNNNRNELTLAIKAAAQQVDLQQIQMFTQN